MPDSAYIDSCVFIELLQKSDPTRLHACEELQRQAVAKTLIMVTSALTITEVNKLPKTKMLREEQSKAILAYFENPYIAIRPVNRETAEAAHDLTRTHGIENLDAIHVATALLAKVPVLYTYDDKKGKKSGLLTHHLKVGNPPLRIEKPPEPSAGPLYEKKTDDDDESGESPETTATQS